MQLKELFPASFYTDSCASYRHHYILPVGKELNEIHRHNKICRKEHWAKMIKWNNLPVKRKGTKPKSGRHITQQLACMCTLYKKLEWSRLFQVRSTVYSSKR